MCSHAHSNSQEPEKLLSKRIGPFKIKTLIRKNAVLFELPDHFRVHLFVRVIHTAPYIEQPYDIAELVPIRPAPIPMITGYEQTVSKIISHRKRGRGYRFLMFMKGGPDHGP